MHFSAEVLRVQPSLFYSYQPFLYIIYSSKEGESLLVNLWAKWSCKWQFFTNATLILRSHKKKWKIAVTSEAGDLHPISERLVKTAEEMVASVTRA